MTARVGSGKGAVGCGATSWVVLHQAQENALRRAPKRQSERGEADSEEAAGSETSQE